jgi:tetratricopeptide (TPR) repeat protein
MPDSLRAELAGLPDSAQIKALITKCSGEMYRSPDLAARYLAYAFEIAERPDNAAFYPKVINQRGTLGWIKGDYKAALADYQEAERLFQEIGNPLGAAKAQNNIGLVYQDMSYFDLSMAAYLKAASYFETLADQHILATIYNNIGNVGNANNDDPQAQVYYTKALKLFVQYQDTNGMSIVHNNLGLLYDQPQEEPEAIQHFLLALKGYEDLDYPVGQAKVLTNLAGAYVRLKRFEEAESLAIKALRLSDAAESSSEISISHLKLGEIYLKWGRYPEAIAQAKASLTAGEGEIALLAEAGAHEVMAVAYEKSAQFELALGHYKTFAALNDSVFSRAKARSIAEMRTKYDLELKEKALENFAQQERIDSLWKWGLVMLIVLLVVLGAVIYARQRAIIRRELVLKEKDRQMHAAQNALGEAELKAREAELKARESELKAADLVVHAAASDQLRLKNEISFKSREISSLAMNIVRQNDLLVVLDRELKAMRKGADEQKLKELSLLVSQTLSLENERKEFQLYIQEAQQNFFLRLEADFPDLSPKEKRLCAMIKLGLSSKEIAAVFNIAGSSVEVARHRLRKKLNLDPSAGLKEFLETF